MSCVFAFALFSLGSVFGIRSELNVPVRDLPAGSGSGPYASLGEMAAAFSALYPEAHITVASVGSGAAAASLWQKNNCEKKFIPEVCTNATSTGTQWRPTIWGNGGGLISDQDHDEHQNLDIQMLPSMGGPIVLAYGKEVTSTPFKEDAPDANLALNMETIVRIFGGNITMWNDPLIRSLNPHLNTTLPAMRIHVWVREDKSGMTEALTMALESGTDGLWDGSPGAFGKAHKKKNAWIALKSAFCSIDDPNCYYHMADGQDGIGVGLLRKPGSIGYLDYGYGTKLAKFVGLVHVVNAFSGKGVAPTIPSIKAALEGTTFDKRFRILNTPTTNAEAYPINRFTYFYLKKSAAAYHGSNGGCYTAWLVAKFVTFSYGPVGQAAASKHGWVIPSDRIMDTILDGDNVSIRQRMEEMRCYDTETSAEVYVKDYIPLPYRTSICPAGMILKTDLLNSFGQCSGGYGTCCSRCQLNTFAPQASSLAEALLSQCHFCPANSITLAESSTSRQDCLCKEGFVGELGQTDVNGGECWACDKRAFKCVGERLIEVNWRFYKPSNSYQAYICPQSDSCPASSNLRYGNESTCSKGNGGPLCAVCDDGYFQVGSVRCFPCPDNSVTIVQWVVIVVLMVALFVIIFVRVDVSYNDTATMGLFMSFLQVVNKFGIYDIGIPAASARILGILGAVNLRIAGLSCTVGKVDHYFNFIFAVLNPVVLALMLLAIYSGLIAMSQRRYGHITDDGGITLRHEKVAAKNLSLRNFILILRFIFPVNILVVLEMLVCAEVNGINYLKADYSIKCSGEKYDAYLVAGVFLLLIYGVGVPLVLVYYIRSNKMPVHPKESVSTDVVLIQRQTSKIEFSASHSNAVVVDPRHVMTSIYKSRFRLWDFEECFRKLCFFAVPVLVEPGSGAQLWAGLFLASAFLILHLACQPYRERHCNYLQTMYLSVLLFYLVGGVGFKAVVIEEQAEKDLLGFAMGLMLTLCSMVGLFSCGFGLSSEKTKRKIRSMLGESVSADLKRISLSGPSNVEDDTIFMEKATSKVPFREDSNAMPTTFGVEIVETVLGPCSKIAL